MSNFSQKFKELREDRGWTQEQAADALDVSRSAIAGYESSDKNRVPRDETLIKIADIFKVSTDYLLGRTNIKSYDGNMLVRERRQDSPKEHFATWARSRVRSDYTPEELEKLENRVQNILKMFDEEIEEIRKKGK